MTALGEWDDTPVQPDAEPLGQASEDGLMYPHLGAFVANYLAIVYARDIDNRTTYWCPEWWRHPEALARLDALWRAWEHLRRDPALGPSIWWRDHADYHMPLLMSQDGPFRRCGADRGHTLRTTQRLQTTPAPDHFWLAEEHHAVPRGPGPKELVHTRPWPDFESLRTAFDWIEMYYNTRHRHSTLGYLTPREYEQGIRSIYQLAA